MAGRFVLTPAVGFLTAIQNALNDMKVTDMQDADFTGLANGDVLVWNSGTLKWEAGTAGGGGITEAQVRRTSALLTT